MPTERALTPKTLLAASSGNALEFYDFTVYGFLAPIIGHSFFPSEDKTVSLLSAFAVLAMGYLARPLGSVIFGHIGDRIGRKRSLIISVSLMGVASLLLALLPTYKDIGVLAAVLLVALRVVQGIAVAGEYTASGVLVAESTSGPSRCFKAAWIPAAMMLGCVLGSGVPALVGNLLGDEVLATWGWRLPFALGAVIAFVSLILRATLSETIDPAAKKTQGSPVVRAVRGYWSEIIQMMVLMMPFGVVYFLVFVYASSYLTETMHFTTAQALDISTANLIVVAAFVLVVGWLADRLGYRRVLLITSGLTLLFSWPLWWLMHQESLTLVFLGQLGFALLNAVGWGLSVIVLTNMVPAPVRCSSIALGYNIGAAIFGGTTPVFVTYLVARTHDDYAPVYYVFVATILALLVIWRLPKRNPDLDTPSS